MEFILRDIEKLSVFFKSLNMAINFSKTQFMIFRVRGENCFDEVVFENRSIVCVSQIEYLGLTIDSNLDWQPHAIKILNTISKYAGVFWRLRRLVNGRTMLPLYFSHIQSYLLYLLPVWGAASSGVVRDILGVQNRIFKCIFHKSIRFPTNELYTAVVPDNVLMFPQLVEYETIKFIYRLSFGLIKCGSFLRTNFR
jgi:hypothetical protein